MDHPALLGEKSQAGNALSPTLPAEPGSRLGWYRLLGSARGLAIAAAADRHSAPVLVITRNVPAAIQLEEEIRFYRANRDWPVQLFPDWECLPYDVFSPHQDLVSQRLAALAKLPTLRRGVVLVAVPTLLTRLPPRDYVAAHSFILNTGERVDVETLRHQLAQASYQNVTQVMEPGEFAVRGGLIDLYPVGSALPYRIDLLDDAVETIREFDPQTQRSGKILKAIQLLPAREYPLTPDAVQRFRQAFRARFEGDPQKVALYRDISKGLPSAGIEYYLPLFFGTTASFFDYLPSTAVCISEHGVEQAAAEFTRDVHSRYEQLRHDVQRPLLRPDEIFFDAGYLSRGMSTHPRVELFDISADASALADQTCVTFATHAPPSLPVEHKADLPYRALFDFIAGSTGRTLIVAETAGRRETLRGLLHDHDVAVTDVVNWDDFVQRSERLCLAAAPLERGLRIPQPDIAIITEPQLYGERAVQRRRRAHTERDVGAIIRSLAELRTGDPVVHEDHGVGRYLGLETIDVGSGLNEFLALEYAGGDKLYIPVLSLHLISRYTGTDPEHAPLHKLGGDAWDKAKQRALRKAHDAAAELLEIHALRAARQGHAFAPRDEHYQAFADAFPFEETPDQARAIDEVIGDMETEKSMDRLVCGDVGFGKTEVAMRAAFAAVHGGTQVAVLVPTTLLAQQHHQNFRDRFAGTPFRIELLSRFRSKAEQAHVVGAVGEGAVHIVIGTHRLLQSDIRFKRLGLLILDEEHRFGVRQKERLKRLRSEVDILTLTATPIPRTLNMALAGMRDISIIGTAPEGRLSIKTLVNEWDRGLIREAVLREIRRGGQVYYLHNEVRTIERTARHLHESVPEAEVRIAHGQMPERELEHIMLDFYHRRFNVLVCSTIIESGIDVPTANTMIIERADKFGLAQLHQLRGRVGRSNHRAYAYLLVPPRNLITADARKRLEAIESLDELGAGFALASHDLEIRGAGELLGEAQSGEIDEVGFTLYSELLARAVRTLQSGGALSADGPPPSAAEIDLHAPALLPDSYLPDVHLRLVLYQRIASAPSLEALQELQEEVVDRFGILPEAGKLLFRAAGLKVRAAPLGIKKIDAAQKGARIEFIDKPPIDPGVILRLLQTAPRRYRLDGPNRLRLLQELPDADSRVQAISALLDALSVHDEAHSATRTEHGRR